MTAKLDALDIKLPPEFQQMLIEVVDPSQSIVYQELGKTVFPVQVLPIGREKKLLRMKQVADSDYEVAVPRFIGELCCFYYKHLTIDWPVDHATPEQINSFYIAHLEKMRYNDEVIRVVDQIIEKIDWIPTDEKAKAESRRYISSYMFSPILMYLGIAENMTVNSIFTTVTRGMLEIMKLGNMISNDKMKRISSKPVVNSSESVTENEVTSEEMSSANTLDDYLAGLMKQGFTPGDLG